MWRKAIYLALLVSVRYVLPSSSPCMNIKEGDKLHSMLVVFRARRVASSTSYHARQSQIRQVYPGYSSSRGDGTEQSRALNQSLSFTSSLLQLSGSWRIEIFIQSKFVPEIVGAAALR